MAKSKGPPRKDVVAGIKRMEMERREETMRKIKEFNQRLKEKGNTK